MLIPITEKKRKENHMKMINHLFLGYLPKKVLLRTRVSYPQIQLQINFRKLDNIEKALFLYHIFAEIMKLTIKGKYLFGKVSPKFVNKLSICIVKYAKGLRKTLRVNSIIEHILETKSKLRGFMEKSITKVLRKNKKFVTKRVKLKSIRGTKFRRRRRKYLRLAKSSFKKHRRIGKKFLKRDTKRSSKKRLKENKERLKKRNLPKVKYGTLTLKLTRRNFFINLAKKTKRKKKSRFERKLSKKPQYKVIAQKSIGHLAIYKGRAKSSGVAKKALARLIMKDVIKKHYRILDMRVITEMSRAYAPALIGFAAKNVLFRSIRRVISRPHGYVRKRKPRRT